MTKGSTKVGLLGAIALVVANMIGTGIFTSLGFQLEGVTSVFPIMLLWFIGGLTAFCGAVSYRQLIRYFPDSGGETYFVSQLYGKQASYLTGVITLIFGFSAPIALSALAFANYLIPTTLCNAAIVASALVIGISVMHSIDIRTSSRLQAISSGFKVVVLLIFIGFGVSAGNPGAVRIQPSERDMDAIFTVPYMLSLMYVHYAFSGWNASVYIFREIKQDTILYRSLFLSVALVTVLYMLLNYVFLTSSGIAQLKGVVEVGEVAAKNIFGSTVGRAFSVVIALLLVSGISAMVWAGSRVSMKVEELFKGTISLVEIPRKHIVIQALVSILFIWIVNFETILALTSVVLSLCSVSVVLGLFIHDKRQGDRADLSLFVKICAIGYCLVISTSNLYLFYAAVVAYV